MYNTLAKFALEGWHQVLMAACYFIWWFSISFIIIGLLLIIKHIYNRHKNKIKITRNLPAIRITQEAYYKHFSDKKRKKTLSNILEIRKFEIELYWKRASYFWTFIAAAFAGFGAIQTIKTDTPQKAMMSVSLSCIGFVFSVGWFCVNRGSKFWQENWENHLDMLEDTELGPLYKTILKRPTAKGFKMVREFINGPAPFSVSKINQIISLFVSILWFMLIIYSLPFLHIVDFSNWFYGIMIIFTILSCLAFGVGGRTNLDGHEHWATIKTTRIVTEENLSNNN
jgi:hypothetical protein